MMDKLLSLEKSSGYSRRSSGTQLLSWRSGKTMLSVSLLHRGLNLPRLG